MIAQPDRRPLIAVPPVLVPPLRALLWLPLAAIFAMLAAVLAMVTPLGWTLALRPFGTLRPFLRFVTAMVAATVMAAIAALGVFAALLGTRRVVIRALTPLGTSRTPVCAMGALLRTVSALL